MGTCYRAQEAHQSVLCDPLEGWDGGRGEKEAQESGDLRVRIASLCSRNQNNVVMLNKK